MWAAGTCSNVSAAFARVPLPQVAPICLEVLQWSDLRRAPKQGGGQQPDVLLTLRVSNAAMRGAQYQEEIINQVRRAARARCICLFREDSLRMTSLEAQPCWALNCQQQAPDPCLPYISGMAWHGIPGGIPGLSPTHRPAPHHLCPTR